MAVEHAILEVGERFVGVETESESVFPLPFAVEGGEAFFEIGCYVGVYVEDKVFDFKGVDQVVEFLVKCVGEEE